MNARWTRLLIVAGALLVLAAVNVAIAHKERIKRNGELIFLRLAPVDPRALMQGDYMALRFDLAQKLERSLRAGSGPRPLEGAVLRAPVVIDVERVASLAPAGQTGSMELRFRIRSGQVWLGTNAFFFEESTAKRYRGARFGEFRVDRASGEAVLVGLRGERLSPL